MNPDIREHSENPRLLVKCAGSSATLATDCAVKQLSRDPLASIRIVSEGFWCPVISGCVHTTPAKTTINWKNKFVWLLIAISELGCYRKNPQKVSWQKLRIKISRMQKKSIESVYGARNCRCTETHALLGGVPRELHCFSNVRFSRRLTYPASHEDCAKGVFESFD